MNWKIIILLIFQLQVHFALDVSSCGQEWIPTNTGAYTFRVDCSNLGFRNVPENLPTLTTELLLSGNSISYIDDQAFAGLTSLHTLDLSGNDIVSFDESRLKNNTVLKNLDLSRNRLHCDWKLWWLVSYSKNLTNFQGKCFSPRPLRERSITDISKEDLSVDCMSVKMLSKTITDGDYSIRVFGRDNSHTQVSIYCHSMNEMLPKEYLTLPSGGFNNYVSISWQDLACDLDADLQGNILDIESKEIKSRFHRVRLVVDRLEVLTSDTTFASNSLASFGQPAICGATTCISGNANIDLRGTKFKLKKSKQIKEFVRCDSINCGFCNVTDRIPLEIINAVRMPYQACTLPLGLQNGNIPNSAITATSFVGENNMPHHARLNSLTFAGWCASTKDKLQSLTIELEKVFTVSGISTQGHRDNDDWVTNYTISYSSDGTNYVEYQELGEQITITGNEDSKTVLTHWFQPRLHARYIKITPVMWNKMESNERKICMRAELYGCESDLTSYIIQQKPEDLCITANTLQRRDEYPLVRKLKCTGEDFMFLYHHRKLQHTKTGLCLTINKKSAFVLQRNCSMSKLMFQKVRHSTQEAFLIKDLNGYCARLYESERDGNIYAQWRVCQQGGFTVLQMFRSGTMPFPPSFVNEDLVIETDLFQENNLKCQPHADPYVVYRWSKDNKSNDEVVAIKRDVVTKSDHSILTLRNTSWEQRGVYYCKVWNSEGVAQQTYTVNVKPLQKFVEVPLKQRIIHGRTAKFNCISYGIPEPKVYWFFTNKQNDVLNITESSKFKIFENNTLAVNQVKYEDEGNYTCVSDSPGLQRKVSASLDVYVTQSFVVKPVSQKILFGSPALLNCKSEGSPTPSIEWKMKLNKIKRIILIDSSYQHQYEVLNNGSLLIKSAMIDDEGEYFCTSRSPGLLRNASAMLTVFVTQEFTTLPVSSKILYHQNATFTCKSTGVPSPTVHWKLKKSNQLQDLTSDSGKYSITQSTLVIYFVDYRDEGEYVCVSESPRLTRKVSANLQIYVIQQFDIIPMSKKVLYGFNHSLRCSSTGVPTPATEWKFKPLKSDIIQSVKNIASDRMFIDNADVLHIVNSTLAESGDYICVSYSPGLVKNATAIIDVYMTQNFTVQPTSLTLLRESYAKFDCISEGYPTPLVSWKFINPLNSNEISQNDRYEILSNNSLVIQNVQNKDEGIYMCVSKSPGMVVNVTAQLTVHIQPQVSLSSASGSLLTGQTLSVTCTAGGDPEPSLTWTKITPTKKHQILRIESQLKVDHVTKKDEGTYVCNAENSAGSSSLSYELTVRATCPLDVVQHSLLKSMKYIYLENEQVVIRCKEGFTLEGNSTLICGVDGKWNYNTPKCIDINECLNSSDSESGSGVSIRDDEDDTESDICDYNAQCLNTLGSYKCLCDEGYLMVKSKCEFSPPGSKAKNPGAVTPGYKPTLPPAQDYTWLDMLIEQYRNQLISEESYLFRLQKLSQSISMLSFENWKKDALTNTLKALEVAVDNAEKNFINVIPESKLDNKVQIFTSIVDELLNINFGIHWDKINENTNGTVALMSYLESYLSKKMKVTSLTSKKTYMLNNLDIILIPVNKRMSSEELQIKTPSNTTKTFATLPAANYILIRDSIAISIQYKTLNKLLPLQPNGDSLTSTSNIFSLSFTSGKIKKLIEPVSITFELDEKSVEPSCAFWDFNSGGARGGVWSTTGCVTISNSTNPKEVICECNHLTNFAVLLPKNTGAKVIYLTFSLTLAIGAGLCIILAFITCMSHVCCSSYAKSERSTILCNLTFIIILGVLLFTAAVFLSTMKLVPDSLASHFCFSLVGCVQLLGLAFFCWIFVEAIQLLYSTRTVIGKKHGHLMLFYFIGWGIPMGVLAATGALVYFNKFKLQSRCILHVSFYMLAILVGAPASFFILSTIIVYIIIAVSMKKNKELLSESVISHTKRSVVLSFGLILIHVAVVVAIALYLHFNPESLFHHILGGVTAFEGIYLVLYHCIVDRKQIEKSTSRQNSKKRNSYSTTGTISYSPNGTGEHGSDEAADKKFLIKRSSKRFSNDLSKSPSHTSRQKSNDVGETHVLTMYGGEINTPSPETKPLLSRRGSKDMQQTIFEEDHDNLATNLPTFTHGTLIKTNSLPRSQNSIPRSYQKRYPRDTDECSADGRVLKRSTSKASSIVSIGTHTSNSTHQSGIPVYFPNVPPHYEMSIVQKNVPPTNLESYFENSNPTSRCTSFGIDSDRMSNISSELSNILYELQAFNTDRHPSEAHDKVYNVDSPSKTLPMSTYRRDHRDVDLSENASTFKPERRYAKTEVKYDDKESNNGGNFQEKQRVRVLRGGASRGEADPSDGLHGNSDSIYSSL